MCCIRLQPSSTSFILQEDFEPADHKLKAL